MLTESKGLPREYLPALPKKTQWTPSRAKPTGSGSQTATLSQHPAPGLDPTLRGAY